MALMEAFVVIKASLAPLRRGLRLAKAAVSKSVAAMQATFNKLVSVTKKLALITVAYVGASVYAFAKFETRLANVSTMLDEQSMRILPTYSKALKKLAVSYGESTETLAQGLYNILSASIAPTKALDVLTVTVKAAKAGITETSVAAYAITGILNAYGLAASKAQEISDILFTTVKGGQTTFAQLAPVIGRVTAISADAQVSLKEVAAALATITRGGISTDEAVTGLRQAIIALQGKTKDAVKTARKHGIELSIQALKAQGLLGMIKQLSQISAEARKEMFREVRARVALSTLIKDQTGLLRDYNNMLKSAGATQRAYTKMTSTLAHQMSRLKQAFVILSVTIGAAFAPVVKIITSDLLAVINRLDIFASKSESIIAAWSEKIWVRVKTVWQLIKDLWAGDALGIAVKYGLDLAWKQFIVWSKRLAELMKGTGKVVGHSLAKAIGIETATTLARLSIPESVWGKLLGITPAGMLARLGMITTAKGVVAAGAGPEPTMKGAIEKAMRISVGKVLLPEELRKPFSDFADTTKKEDDLINRKYAQLKDEMSLLDLQRSTAETAARRPDITTAAVSPAKLGFAGLREAWKQMAVGFAKPDLMKQQVKLQTATIKAVDMNTEEVKKLAGLGTVGP